MSSVRYEKKKLARIVIDLVSYTLTCSFYTRYFRLGRPGVSVQVRHDPVPDPSAAGSGTRGGDVAGAAAASVSVGASGVTEVPGGGPGRGSNAGLASGSAGINHPGAGTGPARDSNISLSGGGPSSSTVGPATGGHTAAGSSATTGQSGNIPSNHVREICTLLFNISKSLNLLFFSTE